MWSRRDRPELAALALVALGWGFVAAPLVHLIGHQHAHSHQSSVTLEHQQVVALESVSVERPPLVLVACASHEVAAPRAPELARRWPDASPQGP